MAIASVSCSDKPKLEMSLSSKFDDRKIEIISLLDSTILATAVVEDGKALLLPQMELPQFTSVLIDGKVRAYYISEPGNAFLNDSISAAYGTPLNDKFSVLLQQLDSIEQSDDMDLYLDFVEDAYNDNKDNPIGSYFGIEWLKYADPLKVDSMLTAAPLSLRESPRADHYRNFARLRAATSVGQQFVDIEGEDTDGNAVKMSDYIKPGQYTLIDFWASWCPYCIRELPQMSDLYEEYSGNGFEIIGVAVRDIPADTKDAVAKHAIKWPVIFNTQRKPYDVYGFSGIPHHILIGPDGTIISRGENIEKIAQRIHENSVSE